MFGKLSHSLSSTMQRSRLLQVAALAGFWGLGEGLARLARLPVPGGVIGLALVLLLLASGRLRARSLRLGADLLLAEMLLFFVPAAMVVMDHREFLSLLGLKILAAVLGGTLLVMGGTALTVDFCCRLEARHGRR